MEIIIKTKNLKLTKILKEYINGKINSLERFLSKKVSSSPLSLSRAIAKGVAELRSSPASLRSAEEESLLSSPSLRESSEVKEDSFFSTFASINGSSVKEGNFLLKAQVEIEKTTLHHKKGPFFRTECQMQLPGKEIRAESVSENLYSTINEVKDELQRELKNYKNKLIAKTKRGARVLKKEIHLSPQARFYRRGRIREEEI